ncbi:hypothetical protein FGRMN_10781 [Fusarium graminum]|nr:hypothetical protein FGRMN_10781 [Fusarium graminum]
MMSIVVSYRNPELLQVLRPTFAYHPWDFHNNTEPIQSNNTTVLVPGDPGGPHTELGYLRSPVDGGGTWVMDFWLSWSNCYRQPAKLGFSEKNIHQVTQSKVASFKFTTKGPLKQIDLAAATSSRTCLYPADIDINIEHDGIT